MKNNSDNSFVDRIAGMEEKWQDASKVEIQNEIKEEKRKKDMENEFMQYAKKKKKDKKGMDNK